MASDSATEPLETPHGPRWTLGRGVLSVLLFAVAFHATTVLVRMAVGPGEQAVYSDKLDWLAHHADEFDVIVVGNSMAYRHVDPASFEGELERRGHPLKTFNLGAPGITVGEAHHVLRRLAALRPARLKYVVMPLGLRWEDADENFGTPRSVAWHSPAESLAMSRYALRDPNKSPGEKVARINRHLDESFSRYTNRGIVGRPIRALLGGRLDREKPYEVTRGGFGPFEDEPNYEGIVERRRAPFLASPATWEETLRQVTAAECTLAPYPPQRRQLMDSVRGLIAQMGAQPVFYVPPMPRCHFGFFEEGLAGDPELPLLLYGPRDAPEFFKMPVRFDKNHLSTAASRAFSRRLAGDFANWLDAHGSKASEPSSRETSR